MKNGETYVRPAMEVVSIETQQMLAGSVTSRQVEELGERKTEIGWGNSRRGEWGNIWE